MRMGMRSGRGTIFTGTVAFRHLTHLFDIQTRVIYMIVHDNQNLLSEVAGRSHEESDVKQLCLSIRPRGELQN